jgi:hypothetical protein
VLAASREKITERSDIFNFQPILLVGLAYEAGLAIAEQADGAAVRRSLGSSLEAFGNRSRAIACAKSLGVDDTTTMRKGLKALRGWL